MRHAGPCRSCFSLKMDEETAIEVVGELTPSRLYTVERAATGKSRDRTGTRAGDHDVLIVDRLLPEIDGPDHH